MEIDGQYLTYDEYKALGGDLDLTPFKLLEYEARKQVDLRTQNRLKEVKEIPQDVKLCIYHLMSKIADYAKTIDGVNNNNGAISSEKVGSYAVTFNNINATQIRDIIKSKNVEIEDILLADLYGVIVNNEHIIYNGAKGV